MKANLQTLSVGLESWGVYLPPYRYSAEEISERSGVPADILKTKFGLQSISVPGPDDHNVTMGAKASVQAMERAGVDPMDIDVVIWAGEVYDKRLMQTYGIKLQNDIGANNAWAFDINQRCATFMLGINLVKGLMLADPTINRVLIASGYRNGDIVDYGNPKTRFMLALGASGAAIIVTRNHIRNQLLASSVHTDGSFAEDVYVPGGGSGMPLTSFGGGEIPATAYEVIEKKLNYVHVPDPEGMKSRLDALSMQNFLMVIDRALKLSDLTRNNIDYLGLLHMKDSAYNFVSKELGVSVHDQTTYYDEFVYLGHMGQNDAIVAIEMGVKHQKIKNGYNVVLAAAGIGYSWGACTIQWG